MRDEIDARIWTLQHEEFSKLIDQVVTAFNTGTSGTFTTAARQLLVGVAAFGMTLLTLGGSVA